MRFVIPDLHDPMAYPKATRRAVAQRRDAVFQEWREHNDQLRPFLSPDLTWLLDFSLDDALTRYLHINPLEQTLSLGLLVGDSQRGYFEADLHYKGIELSPQEIQLLCLIAANEENDIYWGELEREESDQGISFTHRIRWHTRVPVHRIYEEKKVTSWFCLEPEIALHFMDFSLQLTPRKSRKLRSHKERIRIVPDPNFIEGLC
jgi:hypothetical protein